MTSIQLNHLTFGYDGQDRVLFSDVSLDLDLSWHLALVGRNGRGKTTLLRILQHQLPYRGTVNVPTPLTYFPRAIAVPTQLTLQAMQAISDAQQWQLERELNLMHVDPDILWRPYQTLSGGEQTKVRLALLFTDHTQFALIDEPTNHLDTASRQQVARYLQQKGGFIVVSHDRQFLDAVSDHTLAIDKQTVTLIQGNFSVYETEKKRQDTAEQAENAKLQRDIGRLKQTAAEKSRWSEAREKDKYGDRHVKNSGSVYDTGFIGARSARVMQKRKNLVHRMTREIEAKEGLLKNIEDVVPLTINTQPDHHEVYLQLANFQLVYDDTPLFAPVNFTVRRGDRVAITGPNGSGKTSLLHALFHHFAGRMTGNIQSPPALTFSLVRQLYDDNTGSLKAFAAGHQLPYDLFLNNLRKLGLERDAFTTLIEHLSMGQQKKVELAKSLVTPANLLVWDEPLNYLDVYNQDQLTTSILTHQPTMLFVEHDAAFVNKVATKVITLKRD